LQIQPYIQVYGDTAKGMWQGLGFLARNQPVEPGSGKSGEEKVALCWKAKESEKLFYDYYERAAEGGAQGKEEGGKEPKKLSMPPK
jgi:hypothetical protein